MASILRLVSDRLQNALTGVGTSRDPRASATYALRAPLTDVDIAAAYSGSGLIRKICKIPALDMVREWREWQADGDQIELLEAEETRLSLRQTIYSAEIYRALGGGAIIMGLPGNPSEPAPASVGKGGLAYINLVSRWHLSFRELQDDATQPGYGEPVMWLMQTGGGQVSIHPSRVIPFRGAAIPPVVRNIGRDDQFWGESVVAQVLDEVKDNDTARASFAALLHKARLLRIGIPNLMDIVATQDGEALVMQRLAVLSQAESIHNATIFDAGGGVGSTNPGETITDATYSFTGAKDMLNSYAEFVCAVSDIPATRLLGRAPEGMNASGDSQQKDWDKKIKAKQELELKPCLDRLDPYLIASALGSTPPGTWWEFDELTEEDEAADVARFKTTTEALTLVQNMACLPERAFAEAAQNTLVEGGWMPGLDTALAAIPDEERFGIAPDMTAEGSSLLGPDATSVQQAAMNGAQVQSLTETVLMVERGEIDKETAFHLIGISFPAVPEADVRALLAKAGANPKKGSDPASSGIGGEPAPDTPPAVPVSASDAAPRTLYVSRRLLNADEVIAWAHSQGFEATLPAPDMHVTVAFSRQPLDWMKVESAGFGADGKRAVPPGGARLVEQFEGGAVVLLFNSSQLAWRHETIKQAGASWDWPEYQPHVTLTYQPGTVDLAKVEPYRGKLEFGPEVFAEVVDDWKSAIKES